MAKIKVLMDPLQREKHIQNLLRLDGLGSIVEDSSAAYCPISLTSTPDEVKGILQARQDLLMNNVLKQVGISAYDPANAPFSPDKNLTARPDEVYAVDSAKILGARYFVGHLVLPTSGVGVEMEKARLFNRISVMLLDSSIRTSRMLPNRTIYLQYENFSEQASEMIPVFKLLQQYDPGMGFNGKKPALLGFEKDGNAIVDLEEIVYQMVPHLEFKYDPSKPTLRLRCENPGLFYETLKKSP